MEITCKLKDEILSKLCSLKKLNNVTLNIDEIAKEFGTKNDIVLIILDQFERYGYIKINNRFNTHIYFINVTADAFDFLSHGGFRIQDEILRTNIQKLDLEIKKLCKDLNPELKEKAKEILDCSTKIISVLSYLC